MRKVQAAILVTVTSIGLAQARRPEHDLNSYGVVETVPGMDKVRVVSDVPYKTTAGIALHMDLFYPPGVSRGEARPAVVFVNGVGDAPGRPKLRTWGQYRSWPRLIAASGLVAVTFDARGQEDNAEDVRDLFAHLEANAKELGIDGNRIGAWACSANVRSALGVLMPADGPKVEVAVMYYGSADVPSFRADLPVLLVRAGKDRPQMNEWLDGMATRAVAANAPWTLLNVPGAHHAFDVIDENEESRIAVRKTVAFLKERLVPAPPPAKPPSEALAALSHFYPGEWAEAEEAYTRYVAKHPDDADAFVLLGNAQVELKKNDEAAATLRKAIALDPSIGEAWAMLGRIEADRKMYAEAVPHLEKAIALMPTDAEARFQLGKVRLAQNDAKAAVGLLEQAVELAPGNGWAWNSLAYAYLAAKQPAKAADSFEHVLPHAPKNPGLLYNTACAYALAGNNDRAFELLDRAVAEGYKDRAGMTADPDLAGLRDDPRFGALLQRIAS